MTSRSEVFPIRRAEIFRNALIFVIGSLLLVIGFLFFISDPTLTTFQQAYVMIFGQPLSYTILYQAFPLGLIGMGTGIIILGVFVVFLLDKPPDRLDE
jgi:hypothetical protein